MIRDTPSQRIVAADETREEQARPDAASLSRGIWGYIKETASTEGTATSMMFPLLLSPLDVQSIYHDDGELGDTPRWFQLYWPPNSELAASFLDRAEGAGYEAIIRTVDTPIIGWRPRDLQNSYLPFLNGDGVANYFSDPVFRNLFDVDPEEHTLTVLSATARRRPNRSSLFDSTTSSWMRTATDTCRGALFPTEKQPVVRMLRQPRLRAVLHEKRGAQSPGLGLIPEKRSIVTVRQPQ